MGSSSIKLKNLKYDKSGGTAVLKSAGVQNLVTKEAQKLASNCNSIAQPVHGIAPQYEVRPATLTHTSGAVIANANIEASIDNLRHNTLKKGTGL